MEAITPKRARPPAKALPDTLTAREMSRGRGERFERYA